jgi:hypothetical protein
MLKTDTKAAHESCRRSIKPNQKADIKNTPHRPGAAVKIETADSMFLEKQKKKANKDSSIPHRGGGDSKKRLRSTSIS